MKILYDNQVFSFQKFGGISRYFVELMKNLEPPFYPCLPFTLTENVYLPGYHGPRKYFKGKSRIYSTIDKFSSKISMNGKYDIFHPTYYDPYFLGKLRSPYVVTVYDMIHEKFSDMFPLNDKTVQYKKEIINKANKIIAISQNTKNDLIDIYGLQENRIEVVHLGHSVDLNRSSNVENLPETYILFVGQRTGYKNFERFIHAFAEVNKLFPDVELICTGASFTQNELILLKKLGIDEKVRHHFVNEGQLISLYQQALCFVYPSLYEGFGIPILEAFATECPVVLSNTSCFPEIAQDGGAYFNPYEIDSIFETLKIIITDSNYRQKLTEQGKAILSLYSWKEMANKTANIYENMVI